jgi:K(+)-stimulated pyrophosphate-energized sodium pump
MRIFTTRSYLSAIGLLATIFGIIFIKLNGQDVMATFYKALIIGCFAFSMTIVIILPSDLYLSSMVGIGVLIALMFVTDYYTSYNFKPVKNLARASTSGHATNIIEGIAVSLEACALPVLIIVAGIWMSYYFAGLYGIAFAVLGMLSMVGIIITIDAYGPITDNAGGIAEMAGLPKETREVTDLLDAVGNTTKAVTKGYAIGSAALAGLVLFSLYIKEADLGIVSLASVETLVGLFLGGLLPYFFASYAMRSVGNAAQDVVVEVRRQFQEIPGIMEYTAKPDYGKCVDVVTKAALKEMIVPSLVPVVSVVLIGFLLGKVALSGLLIGSIITGLFIAISMTTGGAAWDNAKKYIEKGNYGGKGSLAHQAAITGDTVGDPYKDTAGPAINPMIKVVNIVALLIVGLL